MVDYQKKGVFVVCDEARHLLQGPRLQPTWPICKSGTACQLTFSGRRAFVLASNFILLKPLNDCGFLAIKRFKLNFKILLYTFPFNTDLDKRSNIFYMTLKVPLPPRTSFDVLLMSDKCWLNILQLRISAEHHESFCAFVCEGVQTQRTPPEYAPELLLKKHTKRYAM